LLGRKTEKATKVQIISMMKLMKYQVAILSYKEIKHNPHISMLNAINVVMLKKRQKN
jgi:flagellar biosynthesis component FlhA